VVFAAILTLKWSAAVSFKSMIFVDEPKKPKPHPEAAAMQWFIDRIPTETEAVIIQSDMNEGDIRSMAEHASDPESFYAIDILRKVSHS